ncbi:DNA-binding transcriptional LysR family regulator [Paenibacillus sp. SORGH_AS306]|nr:DNA-binding transcriptional LysR family regulator [Paenibacillus sp. SORGH_AS_0306]MDR6110563.1 DNA-binding transcriptional LysR family regulator [Paenibacillus sp. SORGH_AS_0338]
MMLNQLDGKYIYTFLKTYEQRNISKASIMLGFSQSTVTNHIQILEELLHVQLFYRTINGVIPTEKGNIFATYAYTLLQLTEKLHDNLHEVQGIVRIKALESFCVTHFSKPIFDFLEDYPTSEIKLTTGFHQSMIDDVINQKIDLGIAPIDPKLSAIRYTPILEEEFVLIASTRVSEEKLLSHEVRMIGFGSNCIYQSIANKVLVDHGKLDYQNIEYASLEMIKQTVLSGIGIALVPKCSVESELQANTLKIVSLGEPIMISHGIIELKSKPHNEITELFKQRIIDHFQVNDSLSTSSIHL